MLRNTRLSPRSNSVGNSPERSAKEVYESMLRLPHRIHRGNRRRRSFRSDQGHLLFSMASTMT